MVPGLRRAPLPDRCRSGPNHRREAPQTTSYRNLFNLTGWPALVVRAGTSPEGLPLGLQIVARPWREDVAIAVGAEMEKRFGGWKKPRLATT